MNVTKTVYTLAFSAGVITYGYTATAADHVYIARTAKRKDLKNPIRSKLCALGINQMVSKEKKINQSGYNKGYLAGQRNQQDTIDDLRVQLDRLRSWCYAYPYDIFIEVEEPNWKKANKVLADAGISMTGMNASNMRHVIGGVKEIVDEVNVIMEKYDDRSGKDSNPDQQHGERPGKNRTDQRGNGDHS